MKFFTRELFESLQEETERHGDAERSFDDALESYRMHLEKVRDKLPPGARVLAEANLHDALVVKVSPVAENGFFIEVDGFDCPKRRGRITLLFKGVAEAVANDVEGDRVLNEELHFCGAGFEYRALLEDSELKIAAADVEVEEWDIEEPDYDAFDGPAMALVYASFYGNLEAAIKFAEKPETVNWQDDSGYSPLHWAVQEGHYDICKLLIEKGADVNIEDEYGHTPLLQASATKDPSIASLLIDRGADVNLKTEQGTPLHMACAWACVDTVELLIDHGSEVNIKDDEGMTPLDFAIETGNEEIVELLRRVGAVKADDK